MQRKQNRMKKRHHSRLKLQIVNQEIQKWLLIDYLVAAATHRCRALCMMLHASTPWGLRTDLIGNGRFSCCGDPQMSRVMDDSLRLYPLGG